MILLAAFLNSNSHGNGHADHGVVTCAQEAHHLNVGGDGGRTSELGVTVHTKSPKGTRELSPCPFGIFSYLLLVVEFERIQVAIPERNFESYRLSI